MYETQAGYTDRNQCFLGSRDMTTAPTGWNRGTDLSGTCYYKGVPVDPVQVREEMFISTNEVIATTITSSRPVTLEVNGRSWAPRQVNGGSGDAGEILGLNGQCELDASTNQIHVVEGGRARAAVGQTWVAEGNAVNGRAVNSYVDGTLMLDGYHGVLGVAGGAMQGLTFGNYTASGESTPRQGVCAYTFTMQLDGTSTGGVTLAYTMRKASEYAEASQAVQELVADPAAHRQAKTDKMNRLLGEVVPYFRCSDRDIVKVYYYLWSVYLMLYIDVGEGLEVYPHTQSAANNFLGMHRFDAVFQIMVGAWTNPTNHSYYAHGNALVWNEVFRRGFTRTNNGATELPDNFGIDWGSGIYGPEMIAHVLGACDIYEHSGNTTFLREAYSFYRSLFWNRIGGTHLNHAYDSVLCLNKMATILGQPEDVAHWNQLGNMDFLPTFIQQQWEIETEGILGATNNGRRIGWIHVASMGFSQFPRANVEKMARMWIDNSTHGFFDRVPLASKPISNYHNDDDATGHPQCPPVCTGGVDRDFTIVPDGNYYMIKPFYMHKVSGIANKVCLAHLKRYNMERGFPVAPEARELDLSEFGNQYNNFNAGKILLILQGIGGLKVSTTDDTLTFADNLPSNWTFMEYRVPVRKDGLVTWVTARAERRQEAGGVGNMVTKTVTVRNNPFGRLIVQPWIEDVNHATDLVSSSPAGATYGDGHLGWTFSGQLDADVSLTYDYSRVAWDATMWDGGLHDGRPKERVYGVDV